MKVKAFPKDDSYTMQQNADLIETWCQAQAYEVHFVVPYDFGVLIFYTER